MNAKIVKTLITCEVVGFTTFENIKKYLAFHRQIPPPVLHLLA